MKTVIVLIVTSGEQHDTCKCNIEKRKKIVEEANSSVFSFQIHCFSLFSLQSALSSFYEQGEEEEAAAREGTGENLGERPEVEGAPGSPQKLPSQSAIQRSDLFPLIEGITTGNHSVNHPSCTEFAWNVIDNVVIPVADQQSLTGF